MEPQIGDAFGSALLDYLEKGEGWHVLERDDGLVEAMDASVFFEEPAGWPEGEPQALDQIRGRVLDIGAGAGRYAVELQERGHQVVALDISPGAVEVCRRRGVRQVFEGAIDGLDDADGFDTFLLGGHNLGLLESPRQGAHLLAQIRRLARPGARIVGTSRDPHATSDPNHLAYHELNRNRGRQPGQVRLRVRYRRGATDWFDYWFLSRDELEAVVESAGWELVHHQPLPFGSYLAVARLPG